MAAPVTARTLSAFEIAEPGLTCAMPSPPPPIQFLILAVAGWINRRQQDAVDYLLESMGYVLAKRAGAPSGTTLVVQVEGSDPAAFTVNEDGRGAPLPEVPDEPTIRLTTDRESFVLLAGGRRAVAEDAVRVEGDDELGRRIVSSMAVTP